MYLEIMYENVEKLLLFSYNKHSMNL